MIKVTLPFSHFTLNLFARDSSKRYTRKNVNGYFSSFHALDCWCGSRSYSSPILNTDRFGFPLSFVVCKSCGTLRIQEYPIPEDINQFYQNDYRRFYFNMDLPSPTHINDEQRSRGRRFIRLLRRNSISPLNKRVLEIGCGAGGILSVFQEHGSTCFGVEPHNAFSEYCRSTLQIPCFTGFFQDAISHSDFKEKFDIIIISHVLEHLTSPKEALESILSLYAHDDTIFIIEVPSLEHMGAVDRFINYFHVAHPWSFSKSSLKSLLSTVNLSPVYHDNIITSVSSSSTTLSKPNGPPRTDRSTLISPYNYTIALLLIALIKDNLRVLNQADRFMYSLKKAKDRVVRALT